jgi:hypothetical protein
MARVSVSVVSIGGIDVVVRKGAAPKSYRLHRCFFNSFSASYTQADAKFVVAVSKTVPTIFVDKDVVVANSPN